MMTDPRDIPEEKRTQKDWDRIRVLKGGWPDKGDPHYWDILACIQEEEEND